VNDIPHADRLTSPGLALPAGRGHAADVHDGVALGVAAYYAQGFSGFTANPFLCVWQR
jgi:hypothetical protein